LRQTPSATRGMYENNTRGAKNARTKERRLFRKRQGSSTRRLQSRLSDIEVFRTRKFYKRLKDVRRPFEPQVAKCRAKNGELLINKNQVLVKWNFYNFHCKLLPSEVPFTLYLFSCAQIGEYLLSFRQTTSK
jgi:hypothetical protein